MKIIFKVVEYIPESNIISVKFCYEKSRKSIDEHKKTLVSLDDLSYWDSESFVNAIIDRSGNTRIREDNDIETVLSENTSEVITGDLNMQDIVGKVIEGEISEWYGSKKELIQMNKVDL